MLLVFDEVQSGMGRTGKLFAHEWAGVTPDVLALAKGLGGGFPVGACLATERAAVGMTPGTHGSTFGGNPLAMAAANAVLDVMLAARLLPTRRADRRRCCASGSKTIVAAHPKIFAEVRGKGLLAGLRCVVPNTARWSRSCAAGGLLTVAAGDNVVRLLPPLIIEERARRARRCRSSTRWRGNGDCDPPGGEGARRGISSISTGSSAASCAASSIRPRGGSRAATAPSRSPARSWR